MSTAALASVSGKVVIITGASRGLGRAMAEGLAAAGAKLALVARPGSEAHLTEVGRAIGTQNAHAECLLLHADVTNPQECESIVERTLERFGTVHVLVNNAALGMDQLGSHTVRQLRFQDVPVDLWQRMLATNVNGPFYMSRAVTPHLLKARWGRIVNLSTSFPTMLRAGMSPYGPTKAALEAMSAIWAKELADTGVTVNVLLPGWAADTNMIPHEDFPDRSKLIAPSALVPPMLWLASSESDGITGVRIVARDWDASLAPSEAFARASAQAAWGT